jgi:hypothetical protein
MDGARASAERAPTPLRLFVSMAIRTVPLPPPSLASRLERKVTDDLS